MRFSTSDLLEYLTSIIYEFTDAAPGLQDRAITGYGTRWVLLPVRTLLLRLGTCLLGTWPGLLLNLSTDKISVLVDQVTGTRHGLLGRPTADDGTRGELQPVFTNHLRALIKATLLDLLLCAGLYGYPRVVNDLAFPRALLLSGTTTRDGAGTPLWPLFALLGR